MSRLWDKGEPLDDLILRFTVGDDPVHDARLVAYDVRASIAHATMLAERGYLAAEDLERVRQGLTDLATDHAAGRWRIELEDEDVHTALERRLQERIGPAAGRIHLGRSRNDQVLAALRLYLLDAVGGLGALGEETLGALRELAVREGSIPLPGYTHLQRAMPSSVRLWADAFQSEIEDDLVALQATRRRLARNPLGSAAGFGVPELDLDRARTTALLRFAEAHEPVTAVQLSRGKAEAEVAFACTLLLQDAGRLASDLCLFATAEFGFVLLPVRFTTGSSIMPQKRNPDVFELVRARAARSPARVAEILALTAKLPSGYHRDLQLLKAPLFAVLDDTADVLKILAHALPGIRFDASRCRAAVDPSLFATAEANRLVRDQGLPFRDAYRLVGERFRAPEAGPHPPAGP
jgi:argininosuccinate lyase